MFAGERDELGLCHIQLDGVTPHKITHGAEPAGSEVGVGDGRGSKEVRSRTGLQLKVSELNKDHGANGILGKNVIHEVT